MTLDTGTKSSCRGFLPHIRVSPHPHTSLLPVLDFGGTSLGMAGIPWVEITWVGSVCMRLDTTLEIPMLLSRLSSI